MAERDSEDNLWRGLRGEAREVLAPRNYTRPDLARLLTDPGMEAGELLDLLERRDAALAELWIPGARIFRRQIFVQRHRGFFGELGRVGTGIFEELGAWPRQWSAAMMYAGTSKGFHIHPPHVPEDEEPQEWFAGLFPEAEKNGFAPPAQEPPLDREQWDVMYFLRGRVELFLLDERAGLPRRRLRVWVDGDNHRGPHNAGVVIPPGVAHALRVEGSEDLVMAYGTTTTFEPRAEGRIYSGIETARLPEDWRGYFEGSH